MIFEELFLTLPFLSYSDWIDPMNGNATIYLSIGAKKNRQDNASLGKIF